LNGPMPSGLTPFGCVVVRGSTATLTFLPEGLRAVVEIEHE
jgi:hypothetical protein